MNEKATKKFIALNYKLYTIDSDGVSEMVEETNSQKPFWFITEMGFTLDDFAKKVSKLSVKDTFDFILEPEQAYGPYYKEGIRPMSKDQLTVNDKFDEKRIYVGAEVPLQSENGETFKARVKEVREKDVVLDLNHPFAGLKLNFKGDIVENRETTEDEVNYMLEVLSGKAKYNMDGPYISESDSCSGCCSGCEGESCDNDDCECGSCK